MLCLLTLTVAVSGCATIQTEGRASAILDAARPSAKAHATALADGDRDDVEASGARLLAILALWYRER